MAARCGGIWQLAIAVALVACKTEDSPVPTPEAAEGDPLWGFEHWRNARPQIPQVRDIDALFDSAPPSQRQAVRSALLVCRIDAVENADTRDVVFLRHGKPVGPTNPDLTLGLTIGRRPMRIAKGKSNSWRSTVSFAGLDLARGDRVRALVWDYDEWTADEVIGEVSATFDGSSPLVMRNKDVTVECRVVPDDVVATHGFSSLREADVALDRLAAALVPDFQVEPLGLPKREREVARRAISDAASYVGWNPPEVRLRVTREQELGREWTRRVRARGDALVAELPAPGELLHVPSARAAIAATLACNPQCTLRVDVAPDESVQLFIKSDVGLRLIARDGTSFFTREVKVESSGRVLAAELLTVEPGQRYTVTFDAADAAQAELAVVRIRKSAPLVLRVR